MNRFCKSTFSLLLATLLLFSAAGIAFQLMARPHKRVYSGAPSQTRYPLPKTAGEWRAAEKM